MAEKITWVDTDCPACGSAQKELKYQIKEYKLQTCQVCSLVYISPRPTETYIANLYHKDYFEGHGFDTSIDYKKEFLNPPASEIHFQRMKLDDIKFLLGDRKEKPKFLDVGCGYGLFLKTASEYGFDVEGIELCKEVAEFVQEKTGFTIHSAPALEGLNSLPDNSFDVISMVEVIEHLTNPREVVRACFRVLKPGGILFVQTGNIASPKARLKKKEWDYFHLPGHLCYYSPRSMKTLFSTCGFQDSEVCPPRLQHHQSKAFKILKNVGLVDKENKPRLKVLSPVLTATNMLMDFREILLSPGLFGFGVKK